MGEIWQCFSHLLIAAEVFFLHGGRGGLAIIISVFLKTCRIFRLLYRALRAGQSFASFFTVLSGSVYRKENQAPFHLSLASWSR